MAKDPRFQALKEAYKDKHYSDDHIAQALQLCREYHGYNDDWYPDTPGKKGVFTRFMNYYLTTAKLSQTSSTLTRDSVYNLYSTLYALYTPEQLDSRISMLSRDFRQVVNELERQSPRWKSRQDIITEQGDEKKNGFVKIMEEVFRRYETRFTDVEKMMSFFDKKNPNATPEQREAAQRMAEYQAQEYKTILANKERLAALAAPRIGEDEGFVVSIRDFEVSFESFDEEALSEPQENTAEENGTDNEEGSKGDRYGDYRTLKLMNTLSVRAKRLISAIPKVNSEGKVIRDDLGVTQFVGGRQAAVVLNKVLVNSTPETMMSDLEVASEYYPWLKGLIDKLQKDPDNQATVYNNFKKAETTFVYDNLDGGRYVPRIANSRASGYAMMREAGTNLQAGYVLNESTSLYTGYGSLVSLEKIQQLKKNYEALEKRIQYFTKGIKMVEGDKPRSAKYLEEDIANIKEEFGEDADYLRLGGEEAMRGFLEANPDVPELIANMLRGMGFAVSEKDIKTIALQSMSEKGFKFVAGWKAAKASTGRNKLYQLVRWIGGVYNRAEEIYKNPVSLTGQYLYNTADSFRRINNCLALAQYKEVESRVVNEGKSLSTYNNVNLLHQTFDFLANRDGRSEESYQEDLEEEFLRYEGMALGFGQHRQVKGWLRRFMENTDGMRENFRIVDSVGFNHVEYPNLTRAQKLTNSIVMFFEAANMMQKDGYAMYEMPIQADYSTAYNFIFAPKLETGELGDELVDALVDEVLIELERISSIQARKNDPNHIKLNVYEKQGEKFQIFPEFNTNGFTERYRQTTSADEALTFVKQQVTEQLEKIIAKDFQTLEDAGVLSNPALKKVHFGYGNYGSLFSEDGTVAGLTDEAHEMLRDYFQNVFYARLQMVKLLTGGLEQFNGLIDYEKRNMLSHATRTSLYTKATWKGQRVGKETQNVVYLEDDEAASAFIDDIKEMLQQLLDEKVISESQFKTMLGAYSNIKTTDGQGFRTLESYRTVQIMADQWDEQHEAAYNRIMAGKPTSRDIDVFMQNIKPVLTGYETIPAAEGENQKPVKLTVLHKYSETVLLPMTLAQYCLQTKSVPLQAMEKAQQRLKKQGKEVDMFLFHSGVKVGAHSILQPFAKDKDGSRIVTTGKEIEDYIYGRVMSTMSVTHTLPFKYYGIAASTPAHAADDKIAWASQAEKVAWANISDEDKITVRGEKKNAKEARELYNRIKTANIIENYKKLRELFANTDELEKVFQEELASKSYSSRELMYALSHLKDGTFALPLFSPNIEHQVQELLASIIKKRLTKEKLKGANILQSTGLGMDIDASAFDNNDALSEEEKLHVVFEGSGKNKRIKYVEVFMPIHDSRLKRFADENGNIGPERLQELIDNGTIPESMLEFIAYRTPSDAEHSVIPCRIKGFVANTGGATIKMPKEIMVMTGHDYDGDKMRCHFKNFRVVDINGDEIDSTTFMRMVMGQIPVNANMQRCEVYEYDYSKTPLENTSNARNNARIELMFAELTSPAGSRRMIIPGGCDETKVVAKSLYLVRAAKDDAVKKTIADKLIEQGMEPDAARSAVRRSSSLYDTLVKKSDKNLTDIVREVSSLEMPYTVTHSADSFDYIMGGSEMIGIYALYNSALQMMQRLDISYVPKVSQKGKPYEVILFGKKFGKLFDVLNHRGRLASLGLARLLNAAVDNNKDPILGYLNQTKEMAEMTFLLFAAGITEEEIHLIYNQPSVVHLIERLKARDSKGLLLEINDIVSELSENNQALEKISSQGIGQWLGLENISKLQKSDFTSTLSMDYDELKSTQDQDILVNQISILQTLAHLNTAASNLATFVKLTRPESESGSIGTTVADIITKVVELNNFRDKLNSNDDTDIRISGMRDVIRQRDVHEGWEPNYVEEVIGNELPEVVALNSLMIDSSLEMFRPYFPQAKASWVNVAANIASQYNYRKLQKGTVERILNEMILWKLLSNKKFVEGDPQVEQKRIVIDVPKQVKDLKERIFKAQQNPGTDSAAEELIGNAFLEKLTTTSPENSKDAPRLMFSLNGPAVEGQADSIKAFWGAMLNSSDEGIRQLGLDLFKYNLYTNGFSYGMYEFAHFAPFSVLVSTPSYIEALQDVLKSDWNSDDEIVNFTHQYYMNHWGDKKFIPKIAAGTLKTTKLPEGISGQIWLSSQGNDPDLIARLRSLLYVVLTSGENGTEQTLYRIEQGNPDAAVVLVKAQKLGTRNRSQQVTLQYNPTLDYHVVKPVVAENNSAWGQLDDLNIYGESNINAPGMPSSSDLANPFAFLNGSQTLLGTGFFGLSAATVQMQKVEEKAEKAVEKNEKPLADAAPTPTAEELGAPIPDFGLGFGPVDMSALQDAIVGTSFADENPSSENGQFFSIVRQDENGNVVTEKLPASPRTIREARKQKTFVELNRKLREILRSKGIDVGVLTHAEARLAIAGVTDFDTANVTAEGLLEMIRIANGYEGEQALPEEFAHISLEMLGHDHVLVERLLNALRGSRESMQEAYNGLYEEYERRYGTENQEKLVVEAAGKLVAKHLFLQQEIQSSPVRRLVHRVVDAIKALLRRFSRDEVQNAIFDANQIASKIAREMLGGRLLDEMSLENVSQSGQFLSAQKDLTGKEDILSKLLKVETKRLSIFQKRRGYAGRTGSNAAVDATEAQIAKLEAAIRNYKTEDAIITYMKDSLGFLSVMEKSLDDAVDSGRPMNSICQKLNTVRDTLFSFSKALEDIRKAITSGEVQDSAGLTASMDQVSGVISKFFLKYDALARTYFEEMLSSVYGKEGKTVTVGKDKGRVITIHEMATKADHDISLASRWFSSLADCDDYVLKAVDDITREAKLRARRRASSIRPRIEAAINDLQKETGSRDQNFMFEYKLGEDGKMHRTGKYISKEASEKLPASQKKFYDTMMAIKKEADACVPESLVDKDNRKIVMLRKYTMERFKDAEGAKGKALEAWEGLKGRVMDMSDDIDYDNYEVTVDFEGNRVDMLPVKFLMKGKKESYDDMSDDVATSMMAYAGMAFEYNELNGVVNILENAKYMSSEREVTQKTGTRTQRETITTDDVLFHQPFTVKQAQTNIQKAMNDFFQMHIYGHIQKNEGTIGRTRISKRKVVDTINAITSYSQMAINIPQRIANVSTGLTQIVIESIGKGVFSAKDVAWASGIYAKESGDRLAETGKTDYDNKLSLWDEYFDVHQNNGRYSEKYKKGRMSRIFNSSLLYAGLTMGEDYLSTTTSLAIARNFKVKDAQGKEATLWDAYEVKYADPANKSGAYLSLKEGYTKADGTPITFEDEKRFSKLVAGMNFELQGIYNLDDKSAVQQYAFGALIIMYRKWIAPALKRRYAGVSYNLLKDDYQEGYHRTLFRVVKESLVDAKNQVTEEQGSMALLNIIQDMKALKSALLLNWSKLTDYEKSNIWRALSELGIVSGLYLTVALVGKIPPTDDEGRPLEWWEKTVISQLFRLRTEIGSQAPTPMLVDEAMHLLKSPFAAIQPLQNAINAFELLLPSNYMTEIKSGRYKGHVKAYKYFRELPIISMFKKVDNFIDPSPLIQYYKNDATF